MMIYKLALLLCTVTLMIAFVFCYVMIPTRIVRPEKNIETNLQNLTSSQLSCVKEFVEIERVIFVSPQIIDYSLGVGYVTNDGIYAAILILQDNISCNLKWQDRISSLVDYRGIPYDPVFNQIQFIELTGDASSEIYVWLDLYNAGDRRASARHIIYAPQKNDTYEIAYMDALCLDWSAVNFIPTEQRSQPRILVDDDIHCSTSASRTRAYNEFILRNDGIEQIRNEIVETNCFLNCDPSN